MYAAHYPDAVAIPTRGDPAERMRLTVEAMRQGARHIVQGHLRWDDAVGVLDVLERVDSSPTSPTGFVYRVGEIKRSNTLRTGHVMQAAWYSELVARIQSVSVGEAAFILGDGVRQVISFSSLGDRYDWLKEKLLELQRGDGEPGPRLCSACPSCSWRELCVPELVRREDVSLVPGISRRRAELLAAGGIYTWPELREAGEGALADIGMAAHEVRRSQRALDKLAVGGPVLRHSLRTGRLRRLVAAAVEFEGGSPHLDQTVPVAIHVRRNGGIDRVPLSTRPEGPSTADDEAIEPSHRYALYGGADVRVFRDVIRTSASVRPRYVDVLDVIEKLVHFPVVGLGLDTVAGHAVGAHGPLTLAGAADRVEAIETVLGWLTRDP